MKTSIRVILSLVATLGPLFLLAHLQSRDMQMPEEFRDPLPRILGFPAYSFTYFICCLAALVLSSTFRRVLFSRLSLGISGILLGYAAWGAAQGGDLRGIQLDCQVWAALWAGMAIASLVLESPRPFLLHSALSLFLCTTCVVIHHTVASRGYTVGVERVYDSVGFFYIDLSVPISACLLYWRKESSALSYCVSGVLLATLMAIVGIVVIARAHMISMALTAAALAILAITDSGLRSKLQGVAPAWRWPGLIGLFVAGGIVFGPAAAPLLDRFVSDSYRLAENSRLQEIAAAYGVCDGFQILLGRGLGYATSSAYGEAVGLHVGIATLPLKFGVIGVLLVVLPASVVALHRLVHCFARQGDNQANYRKAALVPACIAYLSQSCFSGGYKEGVLLAVGFILVLWLRAARVTLVKPYTPANTRRLLQRTSSAPRT